MQEATFNTTPGGTQPPLTPDLINLDDHADRDLLRLCICLQRMRGQLGALEGAIACIPAATAEGRKMKALVL